MKQTKQEKLSAETKCFESSITREEAKRAICIDFEGFVDKEPSLIGIAIGAKLKQVALDPGLGLAAKAKRMRVQIGELTVRALLEQADKEKRRIVGFSQHEKRVCKAFYGLDLSPFYADARLIAKKWMAKANPNLRRRTKSLKDYMKLIDYKRRSYLGERQSTQRIRAVRDMCAKRGSYEALTRTVKGKWTKLLEHNKDDVLGMRELVFKCVTDQGFGKP